MNYYSFEKESNISKLCDYIIYLFWILWSQNRASISFILSKRLSDIYKKFVKFIKNFNFFKIFNKCKIKEDRIDFKKFILKKSKMIMN